MINKRLINNLAIFAREQCQYENDIYKIFNRWSTKNGVVLKNLNDIKLALNVINEIKKNPENTLLEEALKNIAV